MPKNSEDPLSNNKIFLKSIPRVSTLLVILIFIGILVGLSAVSIMGTIFKYSIAKGVLIGMITGTLVLIVPTLLTVIFLKLLKSYITTKYLLFISIIGVGAYSIFLLLGNALFAITHNYGISAAIIIVGDASIYGWWFFIMKILIGKQKSSIAIPFIQPTLNLLIYLPYSKFIFTFSIPLGVLLAKLYAAIFIFLLMGYMILYIFNKPFKKSVGFQAIDAMSQFIQNWLFNIDTNPPLGISNIGINSNINTDTIVFKSGKSLKAIFFIPDIHYGPLGSIGGSNFPYLLERYAQTTFKVPAFIMHTAVNLDKNPIASNEFPLLSNALKISVEKCLNREGTTEIQYYSSNYKSAKINVLSMGKNALASFTRAPHVTEDIAPDVAKIFKNKMENKFGYVMLVDSHNSRYEEAPKEELDGVIVGSRIFEDYVKAIDKLSKPLHSNRQLKMGVASIELFNAMGRPKDLTNGNLNIAIFAFNSFKNAILQFNSNNILPELRNKIVRHVKRVYNIDLEVYTTDTHAVNTLDLDASNVLGRYSNHSKIIKYVDIAIKRALSNIENVSVLRQSYTIPNFKVWGPSSRERLEAVLESVYEIAKIMVPIVIVSAFIVATLVILII
ncbi:MAG: DUF2070 family protein [Candidatus Micrarchaeia archaeon]